jgi:hypothetical protein
MAGLSLGGVPRRVGCPGPAHRAVSRAACRAASCTPEHRSSIAAVAYLWLITAGGLLKPRVSQ